jgi:hypothetical protein
MYTIFGNSDEFEATVWAVNAGEKAWKNNKKKIENCCVFNIVLRLIKLIFCTRKLFPF